jgi:hypothetical protein
MEIDLTMKLFAHIVSRKNLTRAGVLFSVVFLLFGIFNVSNTPSVNAQTRIVNIRDGNITANAVIDSDGRYRGIIDCRLQRQNASNTFSTCTSFFLEGMEVGATYNGEQNILSTERNNGTSYNIDGVSLTCFSSGVFTVSTDCYIQGDNGNVELLSSAANDAGQECLRNGIAYDQCPGVRNEVSSKADGIRNGVGPLSILNNQVSEEQRDAVDAGNDKAQELSDASGIVCRSLLDENDQPVYYCLRDGQPVGPQGEELSAECQANESEGRVLFRIDGNDQLTDCLSSEESETVQDSAVNNEETNQTTAQNEERNNPLADLGAFLLKIIAQILFIIVWALSSLAAIILGWVMEFLVALLQINPAGQDFLSVAIEPWRVVVSIANLITLFSFLYTGFRYILGVKNKRPIGDFLVSVIVVVLLINFTIFGAALFVNITQGIGDTFVGAYSSVAAPGQDLGEILFKDFVDGIQQISLIRCDGAEVALGVEDGNCSNQGGGAGFIDVLSDENKVIAALAGEASYLTILIFAIFVAFQALIIALVRVVALWLLLVTSPFALAAYFSPVPQLRKLADKWVQYFLNYSMIYPVMILGFVLVSILARTFGEAARANLDFTSGSGISVAAAGEANALQQVFPLILAGIVSIGALWLMLGFLKTFKNVTDSLYNLGKAGLKKLGQGAVGLGRLSGAAIAGTGAKGAKSVQKRIGTLQSRKALRDAEIQKIKDDGSITGTAEKRRIADIERKYGGRGRNSLESRISRLQRNKASYERLQARGKDLQYLPERVKSLAQTPKKAWKNLNRRWEADRAQYKAEKDMEREIALRSKGFGWMFDDGESPLSNYTTEMINNALNDKSNPDWAKQRIQNAGIKASQKVFDSKAKLTRDEAMSVARQLSNKAQGNIGNLSGREQELFTQAMNQTLNTDIYGEEISQDEGLMNMARQAYDNRLLNDDIEERLDQLPIFQTKTDDQIRLGERMGESSKAFDSTPSWAMTPQAQEAYLRQQTSAGRGKQAVEKLNNKMGAVGGVAQVSLSRMKIQGDDEAQNMSLEYRGARENMFNFVQNRAVDQTKVAAQLNRAVSTQTADSDANKISDAEVNRIYTQSNIESFGANTVEEVEKAFETKSGDTWDQITRSQVYRATTKQEGLNGEGEVNRLARETIVAGLTARKENEGVYQRQIRDAAVNQNKQLQEYRAAAGGAEKAKKAYDKIISNKRNGQVSTAEDFRAVASYQVAKQGSESFIQDFGTEMGGRRGDFEKQMNKYVDIVSTPTASTAEVQRIKQDLINQYGNIQNSQGQTLGEQFESFSQELPQSIQTSADELASTYKVKSANDADIQQRARTSVVNKVKENLSKEVPGLDTRDIEAAIQSGDQSQIEAATQQIRQNIQSKSAGDFYTTMRSELRNAQVNDEVVEQIVQAHQAGNDTRVNTLISGQAVGPGGVLNTSASTRIREVIDRTERSRAAEGTDEAVLQADRIIRAAVGSESEIAAEIAAKDNERTGKNQIDELIEKRKRVAKKVDSERSKAKEKAYNFGGIMDDLLEGSFESSGNGENNDELVNVIADDFDIDTDLDSDES